MVKSERHILSTRPLEPSLLEEAAHQNALIDVVSFIETAPVHEKPLTEKIIRLSHEKITAVFTSMNAVDAVAAIISTKADWRVYAIGSATKKLVEERLTHTIAGTAGYAEQLADKIIADGVQHVTFFCGNMRRDALPGKLKAAGIAVEELVVYQTTETPKRISKQYAGILFYSPSAVRSFFSVNKVDGNTVLFAIGNTTAEALRQYSSNKISIAGSTGKEELVRHALHYFQEKFH